MVIIPLRKKIVLSFIQHYYPGQKSGGPAKSVNNIVKLLKTYCDFKIVTSNKDIGSAEQYLCKTETWLNVFDAQVFYLPQQKQKLHYLYNLLKKTQYDIIYLNSLFNIRFTLYIIFLFSISNKKNIQLIISPRGELSKGALSLKKTKKILFIKLFKLLSIHKNLIWHATSKLEVTDIKNVFGENIVLRQANNLTVLPNDSIIHKPNKIQKKQFEPLKFIFVSRISRKKNLTYALNILKEIKTDLFFDIYGPIEDELYWAECKQVISTLPSNIKINYKGFINNQDIFKLFSLYDLFFFPTLGENYGHVIIESLLAGCPVLLSNRTRWNDLEEKGAGWIIDLAKRDSFVEIINRLNDMTIDEYHHMKINAYNYAKDYVNQKEFLSEYFKLFNLKKV